MADVTDYSLEELDARATYAAPATLVFTVAADLTGYAVDFRLRDSRGAGATDLVTLSVGSGVALSVNSGVTTISATLSAANLTRTAGDYYYYMLPSTGGTPNPLYGAHGVLTIEDR